MSQKHRSNEFFHKIIPFLDVKVVHYTKIERSPNLVTQVNLIYCKFNSCYKYQLKAVLKELNPLRHKEITILLC